LADGKCQKFQGELSLVHMSNTTKKTPVQPTGSKWIMVKRNGEPEERIIINVSKKALCVFESEDAIDRYIACNPLLVSLGCHGTKTRISLLAAIEIMQRRDDCAFVSLDWIPGAEQDVIVPRAEYLNQLERQLVSN
jgi:hypothetical protein